MCIQLLPYLLTYCKVRAADSLKRGDVCKPCYHDNKDQSSLAKNEIAINFSFMLAR